MTIQSSPFFSILLPTRQRHKTLYYAIKTVLAQSFTDFELLIIDNCSSPETRDVTDSFNDQRIAYYRSERRLSMTENWELGLSKARGRYVTVIGDDDGLLPNALSDCFDLITQYQVDIVSWYRWPYFWPNAPQQQNSLYIPFSSQVHIRNGKDILSKVYRYEIAYEHLPMLYNSFVSKELVQQIKQQNQSQYYPENCFCPDVFSGAVNAFFCDTYVHSDRSFSMSGISASSNLSTLTLTNSPSAKQWRMEESKKQFHPLLKVSKDTDIATPLTIASDLLLAKDIFFPSETAVKVNLSGVIQANLLDRANDDPDRYESFLETAKKMILTLGLDPSLFRVPPKSTAQSIVNPPSRWLGNPNSPSGIVLNCKSLNIHNVYDALLLCYKVMIGEIRYAVKDNQPYVDLSDLNISIEKEGLDLRSSRSQVTYF
jgi:hypothetical protein